MKAVVQGQWVSLEQKQAVRTAHRSHAETISRWRVASQGRVHRHKASQHTSVSFNPYAATADRLRRGRAVGIVHLNGPGMGVGLLGTVHLHRPGG